MNYRVHRFSSTDERRVLKLTMLDKQAIGVCKPTTVCAYVIKKRTVEPSRERKNN